jgi:AraC-like DNA-binding protein
LANSHCKYRRVNAFFDLTAVPPPLQDVFGKNAQNVIIFKTNRALELARLCCWGSPSYYKYHEIHVQSLMNLVFYQYVEESASLLCGEMTDHQLQQIIRFIDENIHKKITLPDLVAHTRRSQSSLVHSFKKSMGISIKQYILQKKMALAHQSIQEGVSMSAVAMQFGYENYSVFYRAYRNYLRSNVPDISEDS